MLNAEPKSLFCFCDIFFVKPNTHTVLGRGGLDPELEAFRAALEAKQKEDEDSPPADRKFLTSYPASTPTLPLPDQFVLR
jgi:hypothetical protein